VLVFVGVLGEAVFEFAGLRVDALLSDVNAVVLADVQTRASSAGITASNAIERSAQISAGLEVERQKTGRFQKEATDTERGLMDDLAASREAQLNLTNAQRVLIAESANGAAQLEGEKKKRVELAASLLPRDFFNQSGTRVLAVSNLMQKSQV